MYDAGAAVLANDRAIKFTTDPPDTFPGIAEDDRTADDLKILLCPNPFRKQINISFGKELSAKGMVLRIYDVSGRVIKNLELPTPYSLLPTSVSWSGTNDLGKKVAAGVYFIRLETEGFHAIEKVIFLR
jgi:flagellar hook assembly protein FlgD